MNTHLSRGKGPGCRSGPSPSTRDRILDAAAVVLTERGVAGATPASSPGPPAVRGPSLQALRRQAGAVPRRAERGCRASSCPRHPTAPTSARPSRPPWPRYSPSSRARSRWPCRSSALPSSSPTTARECGRRFSPEGTVRLVERLLAEEQRAGRIRADAELEPVARLVVGLAFHRAFLAADEGQREVPRMPGVRPAASSRSCPRSPQRG